MFSANAGVQYQSYRVESSLSNKRYHYRLHCTLRQIARVAYLVGAIRRQAERFAEGKVAQSIRQSFVCGVAQQAGNIERLSQQRLGSRPPDAEPHAVVLEEGRAQLISHAQHSTTRSVHEPSLLAGARGAHCVHVNTYQQHRCYWCMQRLARPYTKRRC